ncbi:MAG: dihydroorotase [Halothiobacillaceae bacterium]
MIHTPPNLGIDYDPVRHPEGCRPGIDCEGWLIRQARILDPASGQDQVADLRIEDGRIAAIGTGLEANGLPVAEGRGQWLIPGVIDGWARLREPGLEHKATVATESAAAVRGGITTLCQPPDTDPVLDTVAVARFIKRRAQLAGRARVLCIGAMTQGLAGELLSEMAALCDGGCIAVSNGHYPLRDLRLFKRALEYAATFEIPVIFQPHDPALSRGGCAHDGQIAARLGLPAIPVAAETAVLAQALALVEETGAAVHFCNLSSASSARRLARARQDGLPVSASVSAHQLWLSEMDTDAFCGNTHVLPPLRSLRDRDALRQAVADRVIEHIVSDHQPHDRDAKQAPFPETEPGISALETLLPLTLKLVDDGILDMQTALACLTRNPAQRFRIEGGRIEVGARADLVLVDPDTMWTLADDTLFSAGRDTPFLGWDFAHRVTQTWVNGKRVFDLDAGQ